MTLILASGSITRQNMLRAAGLKFEVHPADIDEEAAQNSGAAPNEIAKTLAAQKALAVSEKFPEALVIGSDQILECEGSLLTKANDNNEAREKLKSLKGKTHTLISAVCVAKGGNILWQDSKHASLTMHDFSDEFLESYIEKSSEALTKSVGAYAIEGIGINLFENVEGDNFTILGMPLLSLLTYLRTEQGISL